MASFGMLRHVALVSTNTSEELRASIIRVTNIGELETTLAVTSNRRTLQKKYEVRKEALVWNSELILVLWFYSAWIY
jgi:hypothetical protein